MYIVYDKKWNRQVRIFCCLGLDFYMFKMNIRSFFFTFDYAEVYRRVYICTKGCYFCQHVYFQRNVYKCISLLDVYRV